MNRTRLLTALASLLAVLLSGCRVSQPLGTPNPISAVCAPEPMTVNLPDGMVDLIWRWDPQVRPVPERPWEPATWTEFQDRFHRFCADTGIVAPGEPPFRLANVPGRTSVLVRPDTVAWSRILDLTRILAPLPGPRQVTADLHVFEVPEELARRWGLAEAPATGDVPALLRGTPYLPPATFAEVRSLILSQPGTRVFATASVTTLLGETAEVRQPLAASPESSSSPAVAESQPPAAKPGLLFTFAPDNTQGDGWPCLANLRLEIAGSGEPTGPRPVQGGTLSKTEYCVMGQTTFVGSVHATDRRPRPSRLLVFVTLRWLTPVPSRLVFEDCGLAGNRLLALRYTSPIPGLMSHGRGTPSKLIDWGTPEEEDGKKDEKQEAKDSEEMTNLARGSFQGLGVDCAHRGRLVAVYADPWERPRDCETVLVCFGPVQETIRQFEMILREISFVPTCHPIPFARVYR